MEKVQSSQVQKNVPIFTFSLADMIKQQKQVPQLFTPAAHKQSKRMPGFLTSIRKTTVSQLLQVFKPENIDQQEAFSVKKILVVNAISAIYESKKQENILSNRGNAQQLSKQNIKNKTNIYFTPPKKSKAKNMQTADTSKRSESQCRLNYSRSQLKFHIQQLQKLRRRSGCIK